MTGSLSLDEWHVDGSTEWQQEGWAGTAADDSVTIVNGSNLVTALQLGWKADNIEVRRILSDGWNLRRDYVFSGDWGKSPTAEPPPNRSSAKQTDQ